AELGWLAELRRNLQIDLPAGRQGRSEQADGDRRDRLRRARRLEGELDQGNLQDDPLEVPQGPRGDLVRRKGPGHALADRELKVGYQRLRQGDRPPDLPGDRIRQPHPRQRGLPAAGGLRWLLKAVLAEALFERRQLGGDL